MARQSKTLNDTRQILHPNNRHTSFFKSSLHPLQLCSSVSRQQCSIDCIEYMQFCFRFQILLFTTSERFPTKTLAYLAYKAFKAFMAFKRSRLNPFQNYHSITSFSVDQPRLIRLVYASVSILRVCAIMLQEIAIQIR